jgi:hypothetical protein
MRHQPVQEEKGGETFTALKLAASTCPHLHGASAGLLVTTFTLASVMSESSESDKPQKTPGDIRAFAPNPIDELSPHLEVIWLWL